MSGRSRIETIIEALAIPTGARVNTRVPKKLLVEQGAPTAADKRAIQDGIEELHWVGACKPNTIGVKAFTDKTREYLEIAVMTARLRTGAKAMRLNELIHRAVPYPVLLIAEGSEGSVMSIAHKRHAQNEAGKVVIEEVVATEPLPELGGEFEQAFLGHLAIAKQPARDLYALYEGWRTQIEALAAARLTGAFTSPENGEAAARRRSALEAHDRLMHEAAGLRVRAAKEKQMNRKVELNVEIRRLETAARSELKNL